MKKRVKKKRKRSVEFSTLRDFSIPLKTLRVFTRIWSLEEAEPPNPPLTKRKIFFAFLDVSDHFLAKKRKTKVWNFPDFGILAEPPNPHLIPSHQGENFLCISGRFRPFSSKKKKNKKS